MNKYNSIPISEFVHENIFGSAFYGLLLLAFLIFLGLSLPRSQKKFYFTLVSYAFLIRVVFLISNESYQYIEFKKAGNFALWYYVLLKEEGIRGMLEVNWSSTFYPQLFFNLPAFEIFGANRMNVLLTNTFFTTLAGAISFLSLRKSFDLKTAKIAFLLFAFFPGAINFSAFGLRDPIIYFMVTANILCLLEYYRWKKFRTVGYLIGSILLLLIMRPEIAAFLFIPYLILFLSDLYNKEKKKERIPFWLFLSLNSVGVILVASILYLFVIHYFGVDEYVGPLEFINTEMNLRFENNLQKGDYGSNILPAEIYANTHLLVRWFLQSVGMIILPLPWLITDIWKLLAFIDSLLIIYLIVKLWKYRSTDEFNKKIVNMLSITFFMAVIIIGAIVTNAGNAFRIRLSIAPYLLIAGAIAIGTIGTGWKRIDRMLQD